MKKIFLITLLFIFSFSFMVQVNAKENYDINDLESLKKAIEKNHENKRTLLKNSINDDLLLNTNPEILNDYTELLIEDIEEFNENFADQFSNSDFSEYNLPRSGGKISIETKSELINADSSEENILINKENNAINMLAGSTVSRKFGDHVFKIRVSIKHTLFPDSVCGLNLFYKVNSKGLKATDTSVSGTKYVFPVSIDSTSKITDSTAYTVGHNIDARGSYKVNYGGTSGINIYSVKVDIIAKALWKFKGTTAQSVYESYSTNY